MTLGPTVTVDTTYATVDITDGGATVTVDVPETTVSITAPGPQGPPGTGADGYILQAYDTTDQTAANTTTAYPIKLGTVDISDGITVANNGSGDPTQITFANDGDYNIQFSIQFQNTSASEAHVNVWFRKNGVDIADSNSQATVPKKHGSDHGSLILALNLIVNVGSSDYVEIYWSTESTDVSIQALPAGTTPTTPATPSVIVTATVNRYLEGIASGGTTGQVLTKASATNYDTVWATPNSAPAMVFIKSQTIGTAVASVQVTGAFSSTYPNYMIIVSNAGGSSAVYPRVRFSLGSANANYYSAVQYINISNGANGFDRVNNGAYGEVTYVPESPLKYGFQMTISGPFLSQPTMWGGQHTLTNNVGYFSGSLFDTNSHTSFTLTPGHSTLTGGTIYVYGLTA